MLFFAYSAINIDIALFLNYKFVYLRKYIAYKMKITILQRDIEWGNIALNIERANQAIDRNAGSDLYVLPEMFSTGFCTQPDEVAECEGGSALQWMVSKSAQIGAAIAGSVVVKEDGKYYNRFYFVTPDGGITRYDKHHLFRLGGETKRFTAGQQRVIVEWQGIKFLLQTCYDIRFPIFARNSVVDGVYNYDAIIYIASFPSPRIATWRTLSAARAIENECYVIAVNRTGDDIYCNYNGGSVVWDSFGGSIAEAGERECIVIADIDIDELRLRRRRFPTLIDADLFSIQ